MLNKIYDVALTLNMGYITTKYRKIKREILNSQKRLSNFINDMPYINKEFHTSEYAISYGQVMDYTYDAW